MKKYFIIPYFESFYLIDKGSNTIRCFAELFQ